MRLWLVGKMGRRTDGDSLMLGVRIRDAEVVGEEHAMKWVDQVDNLNGVSQHDATDAVRV